MKTGQKGIDLIKYYESFQPKAYLCPANVLTIGYGHTKSVKKNQVITEQVADELLREDVEFAEKAVSKYCPDLTQCQFDSIVSFTFNLGPGNLKISTLLKKMTKDPNDSSIHDELMKWIKARVNGKLEKLPGLVRRRKSESTLYFKDELKYPALAEVKNYL